jgi:C1A family cysteine protease
MPTLNGHGLGRNLVPGIDPRDHSYAAGRAVAALPPSVDLRSHLPPVFDQGETNSCGAQSGAALMSFLFPEVKAGFSRNQLYWSVREIEGDPDKDDGVDTRNVLKAMQKAGVAPESTWPFDPKAIFTAPPASVMTEAESYKITSYTRLVGATDYLNCLAAGHPFILGFMVPESLDGDEVAKTGILPIPDLSKESIVGGHDTLVVGYDRNFTSTPFFKASGIDPKLVSDTALLVRNSWGSKWSPNFRGHFWMPLAYATNPTTGGDAWSASRGTAMAVAASPHMAAAAPVAAPTSPTAPTKRQLDAAFLAARAAINRTGYGGWVSDDKLRPVSNDIANAVVKTA